MPTWMSPRSSLYLPGMPCTIIGVLLPECAQDRRHVAVNGRVDKAQDKLTGLAVIGRPRLADGLVGAFEGAPGTFEKCRSCIGQLDATISAAEQGQA